MSYRYPDPRDHITTSWLDQAGESYAAYFSQSEESVLTWALSSFCLRAEATLLDVGCGDARLLPHLQRRFARLTLLEPDPTRAEAARSRTEREGLGHKVELRQERLEEYPLGSRFDVVLCSHVLQHLSSDAAPGFLARLTGLLADDGLLILTTCHSEREEHFDRSWLEDGVGRSEDVDRETFDSLAARGQEGVLPTRFFTLASLEALLVQAGLRPAGRRVFHLDAKSWRALGGGLEADVLANRTPEDQERLGTDVLVLAHRAPASLPGRGASR